MRKIRYYCKTDVSLKSALSDNQRLYYEELMMPTDAEIITEVICGNSEAYGLLMLPGAKKVVDVTLSKVLQTRHSAE